MKEKAWFMFRPRRAEDLTIRNPEGKWMEYRIVKTIMLSKGDYENFTTDLLVDRRFIEDNALQCKTQGDCLLVTTRTQQPGLLIIPWRSSFVRYAALRPMIRLVEPEAPSSVDMEDKRWAASGPT